MNIRQLCKTIGLSGLFFLGACGADVETISLRSKHSLSESSRTLKQMFAVYGLNNAESRALIELMNEMEN